jgi:hypothetical protein
VRIGSYSKGSMFDLAIRCPSAITWPSRLQIPPDRIVCWLRQSHRGMRIVSLPMRPCVKWAGSPPQTWLSDAAHTPINSTRASVRCPVYYGSPGSTAELYGVSQPKFQTGDSNDETNLGVLFRLFEYHSFVVTLGSSLPETGQAAQWRGIVEWDRVL